jgi:hypothetical protein
MQGTSEDPLKKKNHVKLIDTPSKLSQACTQPRSGSGLTHTTYQNSRWWKHFFSGGRIKRAHAVPKAKLFISTARARANENSFRGQDDLTQPTLSLSARALEPGGFIACDGALSSTPPPRVNCPLRLRLMRVVKETND